MCLAGASGAGAETLAALPSEDLHAYYVWVPMLSGDNEAAAHAAAARFGERRARHYWDRDRLLASRMAKALEIDARSSAATDDDPAFAWDVYLAYRRGNRELTRPDFWMHQLAVEGVPRFEPAEWRRQIAGMLTNIDP
jgi:hypothetical protein